jgi:hypothetical protein
MKLMLSLAASLFLVPAAWSQQMLIEYHWQDLAQNGLLRGATPATVDGREALKIDNTNDTPLQVTLLNITNPPITSVLYALTGEVRYDSVHGDGFLEMWNYFPPEKPGLPGGEYFSRTLGESGGMGKISGTSDWRRFELPFNRTGTSNAPVRLQVNLILRGRGAVYLGPVKLVQFQSSGAGAWRSPSNAWWSDQKAGLLGGIGGGLIGCLGSLCGWLAAKGKARNFVTAALLFLTAIGAMLGIAGIVALALHQPYGVWYPLILTAILLLSICPASLRQFRRKYQELELRRINSMDASTA